MRASPQEQIGGAGVSEVSAAFERLGWGTMENARHDLGTDLFVFARDERLFDLGNLVGVQVKAGRSWFRESVREGGDVRGWWFRDRDRSHIDAWLSHGFPHLIVLHDMGTRTSYWAHITRGAVVVAGRGAKILVPVSNTVDPDHRDALLAVAATPRPRFELERSAWSGAATLPPRDVLRHALVVPRLVAPHPNAGYGTRITAPEAVALLIQGRVRQYRAFADAHDSVPSLAHATRSQNWSWRFVGALGHRLTHGGIGHLLDVASAAPDPPARTAATVVAAGALIEDERTDEAVELLQTALALDDAEPVDHAWLTIQHARACAEIGRLADARREALSIQILRSTAPEDVTASAIAGVAAVLLFNTAGWGEHNIAEVVTEADTVADWWQTQTVLSALVPLVDRALTSWTGEVSTSIGRESVTHNNLYSAALISSNAADHAGWRRSLALLGKNALLQLDRFADPDEFREGLEMLRRAGDEKAIRQAVQRIAADGPASAVTLAGADVHLEAATRTTALAGLAVLGEGGDLLDEPIASAAAAWLLESLDDPRRFTARTTPAYVVEPRLLDTLADVMPAANATSQRAVLDRLTSLSPQEDFVLARSWARVVRALPRELLHAANAASLASRADSQNAILRIALLRAAAGQHPASKQVLVKEASEGSFGALAALDDVRDLSGAGIGDLITALSQGIMSAIAQAKQGFLTVGAFDAARSLAVLNAWHPEAANWGPIEQLLLDDAVPAGDKYYAIETLVSLADRLPEDIRERLRPIATKLAHPAVSVVRSPFDAGTALTGAATALAFALGALSAHAANTQLVHLLSQDALHRVWAARLAGQRSCAEDIGVLIVLSQDCDPQVRAAAAAWIAAAVADDRGGDIAADALRRAAADPGQAVPESVAAVLADAPHRGHVAGEVLELLRTHRSALVRRTAGRVASHAR